MKKLLILVMALFLTPVLYSQDNTTVSATAITDSDSSVWSNASWTFSLYNPTGGKVVYADTGATVITSYSGATNSSGNFSVSLATNAKIVPTNTCWILTLQSLTSAPPSTLPCLTIFGATQNISSFVNSNITVPRFIGHSNITNPPIHYSIYGYKTSEVQSVISGDSFIDVANSTQYLYNGSSWVAISNVTGVSKITAGSNITVSPSGGTGNVTVGVTDTGVTQITAGTAIDISPGTGKGNVTVDNTGVTQIIAGTNVSISPIGGTGAVTVNASGGSSGGIQYPTANTLFLFYGDSRLLVGDTVTTNTNYNGSIANQLATIPFLNGGNANSGTIALTSCETAGGRTVFTYTGTEPFAGQIISISGFTSGCSTFNSQSIGLIYQVLATGLTTGQFEAYNNCDGSCPVVTTTLDSGVGTLYGNVNNQAISSGTTASAISEYAANVHPLSPAVTGKPGFIIDEFGAQDVMNGTSVATIEANMQTLWKTYRTDGWTIIRLSLSPAYSDIGCNTSCYTNEMAINDWLYGQNATPENIAANNGYYDRLADIAQILNQPADAYLWNADNTHYSSAGNLIADAWIVDALVNQNTVPATNYFCSGPFNYCASVNQQNHYTVKQWFDNPVVWEDTQYDNNPMQIGLWPNNAGDDYFPYIAGLNRGIYSHWDFEESNTINEILEGTSQLCWVNYYGGPDYDRMKNGVIGFTIDASGNYIDIGDCSTSAAGHYNMPIRTHGVRGPATAPSGSCSVIQWTFSDDGHISFCDGSTWHSTLI